MNKTFVFRSLFICFFISCFSSGKVSAGNIIYPWRAVKAIVQNGDNFHILYDNINYSEIDSVILEGPYNRVILPVDSVISGRFEYDRFTHISVNNKIWVQIPVGTPEELYSLVVKSGGETHLSINSVKTVKEFKKEHSFIHITDLHMSRQWVGNPDKGYAKELELLDRFIQVANIIAPDFIMVTGDNIHDYTRINADSTGWGGITLGDASQKPLVEEKWKNFYEGSSGFSGINGFHSPVFILPGNHDFYGLAADDYQSKANQWNRLCGIRVYGFSYAGSRIMAIDDYLGDPVIDIPNESPMSGLQGEVIESFLDQEGDGLLRIMAQHQYKRIDTNFLDLHKIGILLNGHGHSPFQEYVGITPTLSTRPGVICRSGVTNIDKELGFFRIFRINGSSFESSQPLRFTKDPTVPYQEIELNLTLDFDKPNDGTSSNNEAVISNNLGVELPACQVRFIMESGRYKVIGGRINQAFDSGDISVVDVRVDVGKDNPGRVKISKY